MSRKEYGPINQYKTILLAYFRMASRSYLELDEDGELLIGRNRCWYRIKSKVWLQNWKISSRRRKRLKKVSSNRKGNMQGSQEDHIHQQQDLSRVGQSQNVDTTQDWHLQNSNA